MSVWFTAVVAKGYQHEAELDPFPFHSGCVWDCKRFLPDMLCECYIMGYTAPPSLAHESRFHSSQNLSITQLMLQRQDLIIMGDRPCKESFRRWRYHGSQSTFVMRKENFLTTVDIMLLAEFYQANTCSYLYGVLYTGCFRT